MVEIATFCSQVNEAAKAKPLPSFISQGQKSGAAKGRGGQGSGALGALDAEKKYKKNLEALKTEIEDRNREIDGLKKEVKDGHDKCFKLDNEKKHLETRLVDKHSKPPKQTRDDAQALSAARELVQAKEQLFAEQTENTKLRKTIDVTFKAELGRISEEKEELEEKLRDSREERQRLQGQVDRLVGQPMDAVDKREALELSRQMRISQLEQELEESEQKLQKSQDALFSAEESLLDLKFEKETFNLQYARLQKRIHDLEHFKLTASKLSSTLKDDLKAETDEIDITIGKKVGKEKKPETNKMRSTGKNTAELEMLIESLKRVVEKLKTENESLKKDLKKETAKGGSKDKASSEKALLQKVSNLEQHVHSLEMKEVNLEERESTIKKLIKANKNLREDLTREVDRYVVLEKDYKETLMKLESLSKSNKRNEEMVFGLATGSNMSRYQGFLSGSK